MIFKAFAFLALLALALIACGTEQAPLTATPLPDIGATVEAAVAGALPTETPTSPPDIDATVVAMVAATQSAVPTATPTPPPDIDATVEARMAATVAAMPMPTLSAAPTATPAPANTPTPTASPVPTATPRPTPVPTRTPRPTPTPRPTSTPVPTMAPVNRLSEMVKQVRPSVVRIETSSGGGTGVIFETSGQTAYVITNEHVVQGFGEVEVVVNDRSKYRGTVRGTDRARDLAVISICCGTFRSLPFGDASGLEPGDEVVAIGYALGLSGEATISRGIVSAIRYDSSFASEIIQTDAAINPGNSGGPMLSLSGQILGINTFRIDASDSGRPAEGLGFAISGTTVQTRIPALKTAQAAPTPTPTRRPRTSLPGADGFGPLDGELKHNPSDGLIKTEHADVFMFDGVVSATFFNPYSALAHPWDYGFIVRQSGSGQSARFVQIVVTSDRKWFLMWRRGSSSDDVDIAEGTLNVFYTGPSGENILEVIVVGERGLFFVNREFVTSLDLSDVAGAGDIAAITGTFEGNERAGAVTRFEEFEVLPLRKAYGPASGRLQKEPGFIAEHKSGVRTSNLVAEAQFTRPQGSDWDYGFVIRNPSVDRLEVIGVTGAGIWFHNSRDVGDDNYTVVADGFLWESGATIGSNNNLILFALGGVVKVI